MCSLSLLSLSSWCQSRIIRADTSFQSWVFKACQYRRKIQERLQLKNWCLCRWNSSLVTMSVKWQQYSPDHCLRDDILLDSISFLIISSCSIHHLTLFCQTLLLFFLLTAQNIFLTFYGFFFHFVAYVILFHVKTFAIVKYFICRGLCKEEHALLFLYNHTHMNKSGTM